MPPPWRLQKQEVVPPEKEAAAEKEVKQEVAAPAATPAAELDPLLLAVLKQQAVPVRARK